MTICNYRYVSAPEAFWRLSEYKLYDHSHTIIRLPVHLPDQQPIYFHQGHEAEAVERASNIDTHLTAWFKLNESNEDARQYLYTDIPTYYVFNKTHKRWDEHKKGGSKIISRMYSVSPKDRERFYLRMLLLHVPGATSFDELKTIDGQTAVTFHEACKLRHLLDDDREWDNTMTEASNFRMPRELRVLFATICIHSQPENPFELWQKFKTYMIEDYTKTLSIPEAERHALSEIHAILNQSGSINRSYIFYSLMHAFPNFRIITAAIQFT